MTYDPLKLETLQKAYIEGLERVWADPDYDIARSRGLSPVSLAERLMSTVANKGIGHIGIDGKGMKLACKKLGIKNTYRDLIRYLSLKEGQES
jgi:hypothetical protein